jgi:hypothetical protein
VYAYRPISLRALTYLVEHETGGQGARFERFVADLMFHIAGGQHIDTERTQRFSEQLEKLYENPFEKKKKPQTAAEIKGYILGKIRALREKLR